MSSFSASSLSTSPSSSGLYVPVHKRHPSVSSSGLASPSTSPKSVAMGMFIYPHVVSKRGTNKRRYFSELPAPSSYSIEALLSMRPLADENMKHKMREACPEVVMNRRTRKSLEFAEHQKKKQEQPATRSTSPVSSPLASQPVVAEVAKPSQPPSQPLVPKVQRTPLGRTRPGVRRIGFSGLAAREQENWRRGVVRPTLQAQ
jgi:hypothetical protein